MDQRGFAPVMILLIAAVVFAAAGIWYYETQQPAVRPLQSTQNPTSTAQVSTSTNEPSGATGGITQSQNIATLSSVVDVSASTNAPSKIFPFQFAQTIYESTDTGNGTATTTVEIIKKDGSIRTLAQYPNTDVFTLTWSPSHRFLVYTRANEADVSYGENPPPVPSGLMLVDMIGSGMPQTIIPPNEIQDQEDIHWSPDEQYFSYVDMVGNTAKIVSIATDKVVLDLGTVLHDNNGSGFTAPAWINNTEFGYAFGDTLYVGTINNPIERKLAAGLQTAICSVKGCTPNSFEWSPDAKYLSFDNVDGRLPIIDSASGKEVFVGSYVPAPQDSYADASTNTYGIGWQGNNRFFYSVNSYDNNTSTLYSVSLPDMTITKYPSLLGSYDNVADQYLEGGTSADGYSVYNLSNNKICTIRSSSSPLKLLQYAGTSWEWNNYGAFTLGKQWNNPNGYEESVLDSIAIINLSNCGLVGKITISTPNPINLNADQDPSQWPSVQAMASFLQML
jgi:hypothetical protein